MSACAPAAIRGAAAPSSSGTATDCCGNAASWTTGNKLALGTSASTTSPVWFTVAQGITSEVFYPRADVPNMQAMQYIVTDGSSFADVEREDTEHAVSMPDEKALEYTVTNTAKRGRYRITNTYVTDPGRNTLVINTRFQSLDGGRYQLYLVENPALAGNGANDNAKWDGASGALLSSDTQMLLGSTLTVVSALKVSSGFLAHDNGYAGAASDCLADIRAHKTLNNQFDAAHAGNVVQCGQIAVGPDTTFTVALGYGGNEPSAIAAANGSLASGFPAVEASYRTGWNSYLTGLKPAPASVSGDERRRRAYQVAVMALHAAEDKIFQGASVAGLATPWGDRRGDDPPNDGYHRVWGRDLYQQATGLLAAGDTAQAKRMAQFMWERQYIATPAEGVTAEGGHCAYAPGSFPRYSPVSGLSGAAPIELGCSEQLDQDSFAIILAWMTGLTDPATYGKIKNTANHIRDTGPGTTERWEEQQGRSPSSIAAEIAALVTAADIARRNGDPASGARWESAADGWRGSLVAWTFTTNGLWPEHQYYERVDSDTDPNNDSKIGFQEGSFFQRDVVDFGFLDLVRLGVAPPGEPTIATSLSPTASASDSNSTEQVTMPNGDVYFHRYIHDNYGENNDDCVGFPVQDGKHRFGRLWPVLSGERGEYELANGRPAGLYLQSMADATNDGYFMPEQIWDRDNVRCFGSGRPTGSAAPLMWAEGQYIRLAQSIDAGHNVETPSVVQARYGGPIPAACPGGH
jgi:glucoamylase